MFAHLVLVIFAGLATARQPVLKTLEKGPARRSAGIITRPQGSPWCKGRPTIWLPGHKDFIPDEPLCLGSDGNFTKLGVARLDTIDSLNAIDNPTVIDRHACGALNIDNEGSVDIYCLVGANKGEGVGYNELYITQPNGTLKKVLRHGLQRFIGTRTRLTTVLKGRGGRRYVFISASHGPRKDGKRNLNTMFRKTPQIRDPQRKRFFRVVPGPWASHHKNPSCAIAADINRDGRDDLILCNKGDTAQIYVQTATDEFLPNSAVGFPRFNKNWRNARVGDLDGDGFEDLVVVWHGELHSRLRVFRGISGRPYFNFTTPYFDKYLPFAAPDLELVDVNNDQATDIYVVQKDERRGMETPNYCGGKFSVSDWWGKGNTPPANWVPPRDVAPDLLFINRPEALLPKRRFQRVKMRHSEPGCGYYAKRFDENSLVLAQGGFARPGHQLFLEWPR